ncbi:hypothetical protein HDU96_007873 [Phlyctochytrium bullatum]|nr:hypothetical protein HDU96_007873 [Phlyctochytrium bullatum]
MKRLFLLVDNGEIWTVATQFNPCVIIDVWGLNKSDCTIRVAEISPDISDMLEVKVTINVHFVPRLLSVIDTNICATGEDWTVNMYTYNISRGGYIKTVDAIKWKDKPPEPPLLFNEAFDIHDNYAALREAGLFQSVTSISIEKKWSEQAASINFVTVKNTSTITFPQEAPSKNKGLLKTNEKFQPLSKKEEPNLTDSTFELWTSKLGKSTEKKQRPAEEKNQTDFEKEDMPRERKLDVSQLEQLFREAEAADLLQDLTEPQDSGQSAGQSEFHTHKLLILLAPVAAEKGAEHRNGKKDELHFAPDGEIPNSLLFKLVSNWRSTHPGFNGLEVGIRKNKKKEDKPNLGKEDERKKKSDAYKAKLKEMMEEREKEREKQADKEAEPAEPEVVESEEENDEEEVRRKLNSSLLNKPTFFEPRKDWKYPKIIEQAVVYSWFPQDEIFFPATPSNDQQPNTKRREMRKLRVEATSEVLMPIVLECFRTSTSTANRIETVEFLNWIFEEFGFRDTTSCTRLFCRYLQGTAFYDYKDGDEDLRVLLIESLAKYGSGQSEVVPTLLIELNRGTPRVREKALEIMKLFGGSKADSKFWTEALQDHFQHAEKGSTLESISRPPADGKPKSPMAPFVLDLRNNIVGWLRKNLRKYLIKSCKDPENIKKLKELGDNGRVDKNRKNDPDDDLDDDVDQKPKPVVHKTETVQRGRGRRMSTVSGGRRRSSFAIHAIPKEPKVPEVHRASVIAETAESEDEAGKRKSIVAESATAPPAEPTTDADLFGGRSPIAVLQNPLASDFAAALDFFVIATEKRIAKEEQERLDKLARESKAAEEARLEQERQQALIEFMRRKELERQNRIAQRKERIAEMRAKKKNEALPKIKRVKPATLFTGRTHASVCHPSRETLDIAIGMSARGYRGEMTLHFQKMNRAMPVESIRLLPFDDPDARTPSPQRGAWRESSLLTSNIPLRTAGDPTPNPYGFLLGSRKYFVHDIAAPE